MIAPADVSQMVYCFYKWCNYNSSFYQFHKTQSYHVHVMVVPKEAKSRLFAVETKRERAKTLKEYSKERAELRTIIESW